MTKLLVQINKNWADEFDCQSFMIVKIEEWKKCLKIIERYFQIQNLTNNSVTRYFGSNQEIEYENFTDYKNCLKTKKLSDEKAKELMRLFNIRLSTFDNGFSNVYGLDVFIHSDIYHLYEVLDETGLESDKELIRSVNSSFYE